MPYVRNGPKATVCIGNSGSPGDKWAKEGDAVKERPPEDTRQSAEVLKPTDGVIAADEPLE